MTLAGLVDGDRRVRLRAVREAAGPGLAFALRRLLFADEDAGVRAAAAGRLGELASRDREIAAWLIEAIGDAAPLVRDAVIRGLAGCGGAAAPALRACVRGDRVWWVRRAAVYALAAVGEAAELAALEAALGDPFWRVRHAAVKVLAVLGREPAVRAQLLAVPASDALTYLRASWGPIAVEAPVRATLASALPAALLDPDPAVVTARLALPHDASPRALVELLCDPHVPLRELAAAQVAASGDADAYRAALDWLEEPRVPHVADTVERLLDGLGDPAAALAAAALERDDRAGAARWAIGWVVASGSRELYGAALRSANHQPALRRAAVAIADEAELVGWADESELVDAIAGELHARGALAALRGLDPTRPRVRALQVDAAGQAGDWAAVEAALGDPHFGPRAIAARWWSRHQPVAIADRDPAVREASLGPATAAGFVDDPDPFVARAAIEHLAGFARRALSAEVATAARRALASADPWVRAQACLLTDDVVGLVARLADPDEMVRSAALEALEARAAHVDAELTAFLATPATAESASLATPAAAAPASLVAPSAAAPASLATPAAAAPAGLTTPAAAEPASRPNLATPAVAEPASARSLAKAWLARSLDDAALAHFATLQVAPEPRVEPVEPRPTPAVVEQRAVPRAGFAIAPLVISGAFDLDVEAHALAAARGVDTWFWEPGYDRLTTFLRGHRRGRVVTGSYHADAASITADVDRALRRLGRDQLDVFLLFWSRSPARVDPAAFATLERLQRAGKVRAIGFSTHDRGLARDAIAASPWDVVMIRHSAAHPGIEAELLPAARAAGTAILTFSALCYGRMVSGPGAPSPADCYRYSLAQPGVTACLSAPRRRRELIENLAALRTPSLDADQLATLRAHGVGVRAENQRFNALMRQPTRDAGAAARELLAAELPPTDEPVALPRPAASRGTRTRLGRR